MCQSRPEKWALYIRRSASSHPHQDRASMQEGLTGLAESVSRGTAYNLGRRVSEASSHSCADATYALDSLLVCLVTVVAFETSG